MEPDSGCGIGGRCPGRRYSEGQAGKNNSQDGTIYKSTWLAARYVPTDYPWGERPFAGNDFQI